MHEYANPTHCSTFHKMNADRYEMLSDEEKEEEVVKDSLSASAYLANKVILSDNK